MKKRTNGLSSAAAATACALLFILMPTPGFAAGSQVLRGHVPRAATDMYLLRHLDSTNHLKLTIGLPLRDQPGLTNLLQQIYDPASTNYHHYLSPAQFAQRFGPTEADYQKLKAFAISNHLGVVGSHPNHTLLDVHGSVADIEKAFHTKIQVYQHPTEAREFYAPDTEPSVNLDLLILHVSGMDNYQLPHPMNLKKMALPAPAAVGTGSGPSGTYLGYDFRAAYIPNVNLTGTGQTVGLVEFDSGFVQSDITAYEGLAGLPNVPVVPILLDGYNGGQGNADDEVSLDIEMAISMAPGLNSILVYEGDTTDDVLNRIATDNTAKQIGASWTYPTDPNSEQIFQQYGAQGQSFYNAAGDSDAYTGVIPTPADDPNIIVVGGTTLTTSGPQGNWVSEKVWNWGNGEGGSGGISTVNPIPVWQQGISMVNNHGSTTFRNLPDVALTADNIWVIYADGQQDMFGGTSCATPLWAALTALINQQAAQNGETNQGFCNPAIYAIGKGNSYVTRFHDIVTGDDTWSNSLDNFFAVPGYDLATGWGTPFGSNLINTLAPISSTPYFAIVTNIISGGNGNGIIDFDECNNLTFVLTNEGNVLATGVQATLYSTTVGAIVAQSTSAYPDIFTHSSGANLNFFTLSTEPNFVCGTPINLALVIKCDQSLQTNYITLPSGVIGSPDVFTSTSPLPIPSTGFGSVSSPIVVSGLESVGKLTVSVYLSALYDSGMTLQLIGPNGTNVVLAENNGGYFPNYGVGCGSGLETTFDDAATTPIANGTAPFVGTFQPQEPLSVFNLDNGTNLNGIWTLQVANEYPGNTAELFCWSLNISPEVCTDGGGQCPGADLSLTMSASPNPVYVNSNLVYSLTVSNAGPGTADNVIIAANLPAGVLFDTTSNYPVNVSQSGSNTVNLALGSLPVYGTATVALITTPTIPGPATTMASVGSQDSDPNPANNSASASVLVTEPAADVGVTMTGTPANLLQGASVTYTITVTNNGPFTANDVTLATTLPANANLISATTSQGTISQNGAFASLGSIPEGTNVIVKIVISPTITGSITASTTVSISSTEVDPISFNNTASVTTTVGPAADLSVTGLATPSPVVAGNNFEYILTVSNAGPSTATGVVFSQTLPTGGAFVSSSLVGYTFSNNTFSATFGTISNAQSILITNVFTSATLLPGVKSQTMVSTVTVFGQPGDPNTANNTLVLSTIAEPSTVTIVSTGISVVSGSSNGAIGPSGIYTVAISLQDVGTAPTENLVATLQNNSNLTAFSGGEGYYGVLTPGAAPTPVAFTFQTSSTNGGVVQAVLLLQDTGLNTNLGFITNTFVMPSVKTFSNTNYISIPNQAAIPDPAEGAANPYPSPIVVSGVSGDVSTVTVTVSNLFHTYPNDIGMLLVGPTGASCVLMSSVADHTTMNTSATVTFDQNAPVTLMNEGGDIVTGSYQPADFYTAQNGETETYPNASVPEGPYNTNLTIFSSLSPNGAWSLYVYDFSVGDYGAISNGWSLSFTTITPVSQVADLAASLVESTNQILLGNTISSIWTVTNNGPDAAQAYVTNILPAGFSFITNIYASGVSSIQTGATNICNLGVIQPGASVRVTNVVTVTASGLQTNVITVGSPVLDGDLVNNTASAIITVMPPPVNLDIAPLSVVPNPVVVGHAETYTLWVTNNGPSNAFNVMGTLTSSVNFQVAGALLSQGSYVAASNTVQFSLGAISNGYAAEIILTNTAPASAGIVTNQWTVTTSCSNLNYANNSSTALLTVILPTPILVAGPATLISQATPPYNGALNSGQQNTVSLTLSNAGAGPTTNLTATLVAAGGISPVTVTGSYGAIPAGSFAALPFTLVASGKPGSTVTAELTLKDGNATYPPVNFSFMLPLTQSYNNLAEIVIPFEGPANPYPSTIEVSGLVNGTTNLLVSQVTATLNGFAHSWPSDVEAILVSPTGQELALMEHTGSYHAVTNLTLTFEDAATAELPLSNSLASGDFLATEYAPFDSFPGLSPVATNSPGLVSFNGMNPNGVWSLYVYDDTAGNDGVITGGWSLGLTAVSPVNPAALLVLSAIETPNPAVEGNYVNYEITVSNAGPATATGVILTDIIPAGTTLSSTYIVPTNATVATSGQTVTCNLGSISNGATTTVTIQVVAGAATSLVNTATLSAITTDLNMTGTTNIIVTPEVGSMASLSATTFANGVLQLKVNGYPGQIYAIQSSTNLISWTTISTNYGSSAFIDTTTNGPKRFYRTIQLPH